MEGRCRFGLFEFDRRTGELRREGEIVKLSPQPARVLALLLARPHERPFQTGLRFERFGLNGKRGLDDAALRAAQASLPENADIVVPDGHERFSRTDRSHLALAAEANGRRLPIEVDQPLLRGAAAGDAR